MSAIDEPTERHVHAWAGYARLVEIVGRAGRALGPDVVVAPLKGMWLCATGLRHPAERTMKDADLLLVGLPLLAAARRLSKAGFVLADVPRASGVLSMSYPEPGAPWIDLHTRPLPIGLGRLDAAALLEGGRIDTTTFGTATMLAEPSRMAVQLVGNVLKDRLLHANPHAAFDLEAVLASHETMPARAADALVAARLSRGGALVSQWAIDAHGGEAVRALALELEQRGASPREARLTLDTLLRVDEHAPILARTLVRAIGDDPHDRCVAVSAAVAQNALHPLRRTLLGLLLRR